MKKGIKKQKKRVLKLKEYERTYLQELSTKGNLNARVQRRIMGLLALDKGKRVQEVADLFEMSSPAIYNWVKKYKKEGLNFIEDKPRSGRPVGLSGAQRAKITALACSEPPAGYAKWSLRLLSDKVVELAIVEQISHTEIGRILKKMNCSLTEKSNGA